MQGLINNICVCVCMNTNMLGLSLSNLVQSPAFQDIINQRGHTAISNDQLSQLRSVLDDLTNDCCRMFLWAECDY